LLLLGFRLVGTELALLSNSLVHLGLVALALLVDSIKLAVLNPLEGR
jgi:hypothetical protein